MHLYDKPECPFCWKVKLALAEMNLEWSETVFSTPDRPADFLAINPAGTVPVLTDGSTIVTDSAVALEYLQDQATDQTLLPVSAPARARARTLHLYSTATIGPKLREVIFEKRSKPEVEWDWDRINAATAGWHDCLQYLEPCLGSNDFFAEQFSFAECALIPRFGLAELYGVGVTAEYPNLFSWFGRMKARASYLRTAPAGLQ
ncbi:MAG: glutathione S-transferase [Gammaproteobacteria bacterium]|jgi:glutathione S-transferase